MFIGEGQTGGGMHGEGWWGICLHPFWGSEMTRDTTQVPVHENK